MKSKFTVLDQDGVPIGLETKIWSGGEVNVRLTDSNQILHSSDVYIQAFIQDSDGTLTLMMLVDAIRRINKDIKVYLSIPYFPYARQDRICNQGEPFSLSVFAKLINSLNADRVIIYDPHSIVTPTLIENCVAFGADELFKGFNFGNALLGLKNIVVVAPDAGAVKRADAVADVLRAPVIYASKTRDPLSGQITNTKLDTGFVDVAGKDLLIVDDICDGGRTFIALADAIDSMNLKQESLNLYVTFGIFSYGTEVLTDRFNQVFAAFVFSDHESDDSIIKLYNS